MKPEPLKGKGNEVIEQRGHLCFMNVNKANYDVILEGDILFKPYDIKSAVEYLIGDILISTINDVDKEHLKYLIKIAFEDVVNDTK